MKPVALIIDDDRSIRRSLELHLVGAGHVVHTADCVNEGLEVWRRASPDLVILDLMLPDGDGIELLKRAQSENLGGMTIMITGHHDLDKAVEAMRAGAFDYIHKPLSADELEAAIERALGLLKMRQRLALTADLQAEHRPGKLIGESRAMLELHKQIGLAGRGRVNVIIHGESGAGKELVARAIHDNTCPGEPFVPVNCSAIVPALLESELFGHERGAFTGAMERRRGRFELAGDGTLFLDEIGDLDLNLQTKLLRVVQEREFYRVGGSVAIEFKARLIAATHRDLENLVREGKFREDLYYRLKVLEIGVPPLRARREDIPQLVDHFLARINRELRRNVLQVPQQVMDKLLAHDWPGNVRELENLLTTGVMHSPGETLEIEVIPPKGKLTAESSIGADWGRSLAEVEQEHIRGVLQAVDGHLGRACKILGISRPTLRKKMAGWSAEANSPPERPNN